MGFNRDTLNVEKQFTFYASYHHHPANVIIHLICVWPILASFIALLQYTPSINEILFETQPNLPMSEYLQLNLAFLVMVIYVASYIIMEPSAGGFAALMVFGIYMASSKLVIDGFECHGRPFWQLALAVHIGSWLLQFIGHGLFEGRAPALLDSLDQALLTAPLFVVLEVLFFFGYRKDFYTKMMKQVEKNISEFEQENNKKPKPSGPKAKKNKSK